MSIAQETSSQSLVFEMAIPSKDLSNADIANTLTARLSAWLGLKATRYALIDELRRNGLPEYLVNDIVVSVEISLAPVVYGTNTGGSSLTFRSVGGYFPLTS